MTKSDKPENITPNNEHSLKKLSWAITASQEKFMLIFARCNYAELRKTLVQRLQEICQVKIHTITLNPSDTALYAAISAQLGEETPGVLMILGLETVVNIEQMLSSANQVRETFREKFYFPLVFWVNDTVKKKLMGLAPDLESWGTSTQFDLGTDEVVDLLQQTTETIFEKSLAEKLDSLLPTQAKDSSNYREIELGYNELEARGEKLESELKADLDFVFGEQAYYKDNFDRALTYYESSLDFWRASLVPTGAKPDEGKLISQIKLGILQSRLGLCYFKKANLASEHTARNQLYRENLQSARRYLEESLDNFYKADQPYLWLEYGKILGRTLRSLEAWDELEQLLLKGLETAKKIGKLDIAPMYGFLANLALRKSGWQQAKESAQTALDIASAQQQPVGNYLLLLAEAKYHLGEIGIECLEKAREIGVEDEPRLYLEILNRLREFYLKQKEYLKAYQVKQEGQIVEYEYGFRAFIGASRIKAKSTTVKGESLENIAPVIVASGRDKDVAELVNRVIDRNHKVIVIYGYSGVGKSSLINAGLVPILEQADSLPGIVCFKKIVPVALRVYTNWVEELGKQLTNALHKKRINLTKSLDSQTAILEQLQENETQILQVVLILDQFEEFFFTAKTKSARNELFVFLSKCLENLSLKVIFSLRRDYLHYLAGSPKIKNISGGILSEDNLYRITNFSEQEAENIINKLTERSNFNLEDELIKQLVKDLAGEYGKVRPIELQVVGAQLQEENIRTLEQYQNFGTKEELVKRYLDTVVADCGEENQEIAKLFLFLLTDEKGTRPLKTRLELEIDLQKLLTIEVNQIGLVSQILVASGLVFFVPENPHERYQLVHDYLVSFIRQEQEPKIKELLAELDGERKQCRELESSIQKVREDLAVVLDEKDRINQEVQIAQQNKQKLELETEKNRKRLQVSLGLLFMVILGGVGVSFFALKKVNISFENLHKAEIKIKKTQTELHRAEIKIKKTQTKLNQAQERLNNIQAGIEKAVTAIELERQTRIVAAMTDLEYQPFETLLSAMKLGRGFQKIVNNGLPIEKYPRVSHNFIIQYVLQRILNNNYQKNQLNGHHGTVWSATFSPDGTKIVTASGDNTAKIWDIHGNYIATLTGHNDEVLSAIFSPDGTKIVTASKDNTAKIWNIQGGEIATLNGHQASVSSATFSPDGKKIVTASKDNTAKIWDIHGNYIATLTGHNDEVLSAIFSPDGTKIVTASKDKTAKIWDIQGSEIATLIGHQALVSSATFSPDGTKIVTASWDSTAKIWDIQGREIATLIGHQAPVSSATFSPDGTEIVTASWDNTAKIWDIHGSEIATLIGHQTSVSSAIFSPDGTKIVTASKDKTAKIWDIQGSEIATLNGHQASVSSATFSPDGTKIVTASEDKIAKIWDIQGKKLTTLTGHQDAVRSATFSPDRTKIVTASEDKTAKIWDIQGNFITTLKGHKDRVSSATFSPDGTKIVTASWDSTAKIWDIHGNESTTLKGHKDRVLSATFSPDGTKIVTASKDNTAKIWDIHGNEIATLTGHQALVRSATFSPDGTKIVTASWDKTAKIWDIHGNNIATLKGHKDGVWSATFSPDEKKIVTASSDKTAKIWDIQGRNIATLTGHQEGVLSATFSPDGKKIVTASGDNTAKIWDIHGNEIATLIGHQDVVWSATFSPDGTKIVTASKDNTAKIWDIQGSEIATLIGHQDGVWSATFSPDGTKIVTASEDKTAKIWLVESLMSLDQLLDRGCAWLHDYFTSHPDVDRSFCPEIK